MGLKEVGFECVDWIQSVQNRAPQWRARVRTVHLTLQWLSSFEQVLCSMETFLISMIGYWLGYSNLEASLFFPGPLSQSGNRLTFYELKVLGSFPGRNKLLVGAPHCQDRLWDQPSLLYNWYHGLGFRRQEGRRVKLTSELHPVSSVWTLVRYLYSVIRIHGEVLD
jgi:hypothetical protein